MLEIVTLLAGGGGVGAIVLAVLHLLSRSFAGITEQWSAIFATQEKQIATLRKELADTREEAALDRGRYDTEIASAKLAEKQCREDWIVLSVEVRELRKTFESREPKVPTPLPVTIVDGEEAS